MDIEHTLSDYRETVKKINQLCELRRDTFTSGTAKITDMPRSQSAIHSLELCIDTRQRLQEKIDKLICGLMQTLDTIGEYVNRLDADEKQIIMKYYLQAQDVKVICTKLDISERTFYTRKKDALSNLFIDLQSNMRYYDSVRN